MGGRSDCVSDDPEGRAYVTHKSENQPKMFGDAAHIVDYGRTDFGMDAEHWIALQAIHAVVHAANVGVKYTWFGLDIFPTCSLNLLQTSLPTVMTMEEI